MIIKSFNQFKVGKVFEKTELEKHNELVDKINKKLETDPKFIFDSLNKELPTEKDGEDYENLFDEAREESIMFFKKHPSMLKENVTIDISGPDGNAFVLIGYARKFAKQLDLDFKPIKDEMMAGDYDNLLKVFNKNFGNVVDLVGYNEDDYEEEFESVQTRSIYDSLLPEQIRYIKDIVLTEDDIDEAMRDLQGIIGVTDGGVCGMYFSKYDDADEHWSNSNEEQRMEDVKGYLADETSYREI
tara:strand:+ start:275 stop:1003 length:729 start_codon:yes stop_codon:yes gene_type:complete